jgi:hypothetical protein
MGVNRERLKRRLLRSLKRFVLKRVYSLYLLGEHFPQGFWLDVWLGLRDIDVNLHPLEQVLFEALHLSIGHRAVRSSLVL